MASPSKWLLSHLIFLHLSQDIIRGFDSSLPEALDSAPGESRLIGPARIVVAVDTQDLEDVVIIGINAPDRPGLLLDISRGLHLLSLELHHTEATVILSRSLSIWRCASVGDGEVVPSPEEMQTVLGVSSPWSILYEREGLPVSFFIIWSHSACLLSRCLKMIPELEQQNAGDSRLCDAW